ncbi:hypothetical protein U3516DRAFT_816715 [Neocallimastix sp. 'constans']
MNDEKKNTTKIEHEIIKMDEKDKNNINRAKDIKRDHLEDLTNSSCDSNTLKLKNKQEQEHKSVSSVKDEIETSKKQTYSSSPQKNSQLSYLSELDEKQQQFILNSSSKISEALSIDMSNPNSIVKMLTGDENNYSRINENSYNNNSNNNSNNNINNNNNNKESQNLIQYQTLTKQQLQRQINEDLIGVNTEEEKVAQLTRELIQARNIIDQLRDSLAFSDDEKVQLQKEFDCFQDKVEIERLNWKDEFKKVKEIQARDYKEKVQLNNYIKEMEESLKNIHQEQTQNKRVYQETVYQLKESQEGYNQLEADFDLLSKKYKELEQYLVNLKQSNEELIHEDKLLKNTNEELIHENKILKNTNEELMQVNEDLKKGNKHLMQLNKALEDENKKINESKDQYYMEETENMTNKMQEIIQKNHDYVSQINKMKSVQEVIENEYNELKLLLNDERNKNDQCESELTLFGRRIRNLMEQNNKLSKENNRIRTELRNYQFNPPLDKLDTQLNSSLSDKDDKNGSYKDMMMNDYPSSKIRNNLVSYATYSVPKNLRRSNSAVDIKNVKWSTTTNVGNDNMDDSYKSNIRSSFKNSNIPVYTNTSSYNKNQTITTPSNQNYGWESGSNYSPASSTYSNSPKRFLNNGQPKISTNSSSQVTNSGYMNTLAKLPPNEIENLLRSLTLKKDQLQAEYVKVPSTNRRRKELLEEKLDEVDKQMGGCRMRLKALKVM